MSEELASHDATTPSQAHTLRRLMVMFVPHIPLFAATFAATVLYAATMTARVGAIYPIMRVFSKHVSPEEAQELGLPEGTTVDRFLTRKDGEWSDTLKVVNDFLDEADAWFLSKMEWAISDRVLSNPQRAAQVGTIMTVSAFFLCMMALSAVTNFARHTLKALLIVRILVSLRVRLLENLLNQPLAFYNEQKRGELISRMGSDVQASTVCLDILTGDLIMQVFRVLFPVVVIVMFKWYLFFIVAGFMTAISLSLRKQTRKVHRRARVRQRTTARVTESMVQMFSGIRVVKAFGLEGEKIKQYTARNQELARDAMATEVAKAMTSTKMELLTHAALVLAVMVAGIILSQGGTLPGAAMLAFMVFLAEIYRPAKLLTNAYTGLQDNLAGAQRTFEFMDLTPALKDKKGAAKLVDPVGTVTFEDVSFSYHGLTTGTNGNGRVLHHINLEVPAGQVVALVGPSGAGKSTLVNLVPRFYAPDTGRVTIDGTDICEFTRESLLSNVAVVTQEPFLFNTSIRENIAYGKPGATHDEIEAAAKAANAHDFIMDMPRGYDTLVGERGANMSGGQGQRVTIARALIRDARILILDEATSNLDTESERTVQDALQNLMKGRTTLVIAHRLSTVQHADKICVMQDGRICEVGTHNELMDRDSLYRRLYELQFGDEKQLTDKS